MLGLHRDADRQRQTATDRQTESGVGGEAHSASHTFTRYTYIHVHRHPILCVACPGYRYDPIPYTLYPIRDFTSKAVRVYPRHARSERQRERQRERERERERDTERETCGEWGGVAAHASSLQ